jgi:hypothetical protein
MPAIEKSEQVGGAALLGIPFFDLFVWILDNYGRWVSLVNLSGHLPRIVLSPGTMFACLCAGLFILNLSHRRQLARVVSSAVSNRKLLDASGTEVHRIEGPGWATPVAAVFVLALIAAPTLAVSYSLAYKGPKPQAPTAPSPPPSAYAKLPVPGSPPAPPLRTPSYTTIVAAPNGIANAAPNLGNQTVNNFGLPTRQLTPDQRAQLISKLSAARGKYLVWAANTDNDAMLLANDLYGALKDAGWEPGGSGPEAILPGGPAYFDIEIYVQGTPAQNGESVQVTQATATLVYALRSLNLTVGVGRSERVKEGFTKIVVCARRSAQ